MLVAFALAQLLLVGVESARAGDPGESFEGIAAGDEPVIVDADEVTYDRETETVRAKGDVVITAGDAVLAADEVEIERDTGEAEASGEVVLEDPEARIRADRARLELEGETGLLEDSEVYLPRSRFQLSGERMEKGFGQSYRISDGILTTCLCGEGHAPDWSIRGEEVDLDVGGFGHVKSGVFRVKDVPILYLPYGLFPVRRERQSGFLFPQFGISNSRGFQYVQPFYWAIDKSSDATISLDVETSARLGLLGEYRYALAPDAGGNLTATYFNEQIGGDKSDEIVDDAIVDPEIPTNRWSVIGYHQQPGPWDTVLYAQPFVVSDKLFLRDMNTLSYVPATNLLTSTQRYTISEAGALKSWRWGYLKGEARYFQDLIQKQSRVPQPLPRFTFHAAESVLDRRVRLGLNTQAVYYYRGPLSSGPRFDFAPEVAVPYRAGPYGFGDFRLVLRETAYYLVNNDLPIFPQTPEGTLPTRDVERFQHREILQFSSSFNSEVNRVFTVNRGELQKLKHTIEPFLRYNYIPVVNQDDLPLYDYYDRVNARNLFTYGIATRFLGKFGAGDADQANPPPSVGNEFLGNELYGPMQPPRLAPGVGGTRIRELARAYVQNSYSLRPLPVPVVGTDEDDDGEIETINTRFTGIDVGLQVTPVTFAAARSRAVYSVAQNRLLYAEVGAHLYDPRPIPVADDLSLPGLRPTNSASLFYQFNSGGTVENINLATTFRVTDRVAISYFGRFDAEIGRFLENWAGIRLISGCDCWVLDLALVDRSNPDELQVRVLFSLVGLGSFGQQPFQPGLGSFVPPSSATGDFGDVY
jgi:LPS-assembly protein